MAAPIATPAPPTPIWACRPGLDFESKLFIKPNAAALLREELTAPNYAPRTIALGANTDPYQPIEKQYRITRSIIEVLGEFKHPFGIVTKNHMVTRDIDLLAPLAKLGLVKVALSITTLDGKLARAMEPRASTPAKRLAAIEALSAAGIPTVVMIGPIIPGLNDHEIENILKAARGAGAREAGYTMLRLPHEVKGIFKDWLEKAYPDRYARVMAQVKDVRGGAETSAQVRRTHDRLRPRGLDDRAAVPTGLPEARAECDAGEAEDGAV